jgi:hypothetical protein
VFVLLWVLVFVCLMTFWFVFVPDGLTFLCLLSPYLLAAPAASLLL